MLNSVRTVKTVYTGPHLKAREEGCAGFIVVTEQGMIYPLEKENPGKKFIPASTLAVCPNMKLTTLNSVLESLIEGKHEVTVPAEVADKARSAIERMLEIT